MSLLIELKKDSDIHQIFGIVKLHTQQRKKLSIEFYLETLKY